MDPMTLRDAAERPARAGATRRRYIRSGRLHAEKAHGRYGPEYLISDEALAAAGLRAGSPGTALARASQEPAPPAPREQALRECVPATLFQELQMKHEQLLVQYGMVRAAGLRMMELRGEVEERDRRLDEARAELEAVRQGASREAATLRKRLRETELELEAKTLELAALRDRVRRLEPPAATREGIEKQFADVAEQLRRVERLESRRGSDAASPRGWVSPAADPEPEH